MSSTNNNKEHKPFHIKNGVKYWSTTTILKIINRPELNRWRGGVGNYKADQVLEETSNIGNILHEVAPRIIEEKDFFTFGKRVPDELLGMADQFAEWTIANVEKVKHIEKRLFSEKFKYCGRIDGIYLLKRKKHFDIIDIKTGTSRHYVESLQLSAYKNLCLENGIEVRDRLIIECKRDGSPARALKIETDYQTDFYRFLYAKELYLSVNKII